MLSKIIRCRRLVGRQSELATLAELTLSPPPVPIALIQGDAGMGKSRLVSEYVVALRRDGVEHYITHCLEAAAAPFAPFVPILRSILAGLSCTLETWLLQSLVPILPELSTGALPDTTYSLQDKRRQFDAMAEVFRRHSNISKFAIIIEDIHWSDVASLEFLQFVAYMQNPPRMLFVATYRPDDLAINPALQSIFLKMQRKIDWQLELAPLTDGEMDALIEDALAERTGISDVLKRAVRSRVEGNPLFAEELLRHVAEARSPHQGMRMPASIRETVLDRFATLNADEQRIISVAAVVGRLFNSDFVALVTDRTPKDVAAVLRSARDLQLVEETEPGEFQFRHALTREALYGEMLAAQARALHSRILSHLEDLPDELAVINELAYHAWAANDAIKAPKYNECAGDAALAARAPNEAVKCFQRAMPFLSDYGDLGRVWKKLAISLEFAGSAPSAREAFERAIDYFRKAGSPSQIASLYISLAEAHNLMGDLSQFFLTLVFARDSLPSAGEGLLGLILNAQYSAGVGATASADQAISEAEDLLDGADQLMLTRFFHARSLTHLASRRFKEAVEDSKRSLKHASRVKVVREEIFASMRLGWRLRDVADSKNAIITFGNAAELAEQHWYLGYAALAFAFKSGEELLVGELDGARTSLRASMRLGSGADLPLTRFLQFDLGLRLGSRLQDDILVQDVQSLLHFDIENLESLPREFSPYLGALAEVFVARGEVGRAKAALKHASVSSSAEKITMANTQVHFPTVFMVAAYGNLDEFGEARRSLVHTLNARSDAMLGLCDAYAEARTGKPSDQIASKAENAAKRFKEFGNPHEEAQCLEIVGKRAQALDLYRRAGNLRDSARLEHALKPLNRQGRAATELTRREAEIADLLAQRLSNKEIASALSISERTVETHLSTMFGKLGVKSRHEVALAAASGPLS